MRCRLNDGDCRRSAEEVWGIVLASRDESGAVVWTAECTEALSICRPILDLGDEAGARMAPEPSRALPVAAYRDPAVAGASE